MSIDEARKRIAELTALLEKYNYQYYVLNASTVSDAEFDRFMNELQLLESEFPGPQEQELPDPARGWASSVRIQENTPQKAHAFAC